MTTQVKVFETWEEVITNFLYKKLNSEKEEYLKNIIKKIAAEYKKYNYFDNQKIKHIFNTKRNEKNSLQTSLEFQISKFKSILDFTEKHEEIIQEDFEIKYYTKCEKLLEKYNPHNWIKTAAGNASSIRLATHIIKLTHSKIDSSNSSLYDQTKSQKPGILSTSTLKKKIIDGAVAGNQYAPIFQFLELEHNGIKMAAVFADENNTVLNCFADNKKELIAWNSKFKESLTKNATSSHFLAKQIYYPIHPLKPLVLGSYHLLCNINSSSLIHALFIKRIDETQKDARKFCEKNKYSKAIKTSFTKKASLQVTASNHSNASQLNCKRGGKIDLFCSQPPTWQSQLKPPIYKHSLFYAVANSSIMRENIDYLRNFLLRFERINLSFKDPKKKQWIDSWTDNIIGEVLTYVASIQNLPAGWSDTEEIVLKKEHQYFLDPYRDDEIFQNARSTRDWQTVICNDFSNWFNGKLKGKDRKFTPQKEHTRVWQKLMKKNLREYMSGIEIEIAQQIKEKI
jgi:CRISPR-associated protein Csy1